MSLVIDSNHLASHTLRVAQSNLDCCTGHGGRYQIYRVCAHATALHGAPVLEGQPTYRVIHPDRSNNYGIIWQPDQDDDVDEVEVFHHLKQQAATSPGLEKLLSRPNHGITSTTLATSVAVQPRPLTASAQGRPISSFRRYSVTVCILDQRPDGTEWLHEFREFGLGGALPDPPWWSFNYPKLSFAGASSRVNVSQVLWHVQYDFVDVLSKSSHPASHPTRRRRAKLNPFHRVSSAPPVPDSSQQQHPPEAKRFSGVRYRRERKAWSAEMKPPKHKNKVYFGESPSQTQAARMVDAAFHYYGKSRLLNFPDTPELLTSRVIPAGLAEECKLNFVKEQAKWLASIASGLPLSSTSVHSEISELSSGGYTANISRLPSPSEIASFPSLAGDGDEADDSISRPQPLLLPDGEAGSGGSDWMATQNGTSADAVDGIVGTSAEGQSNLEWNFEDALGWRRSSSSVLTTDGCDGAEHCSTPASANVEYSSPLFGESQERWRNNLATSPPAAMIPMPCSPGHFQDDCWSSRAWSETAVAVTGVVDSALDHARTSNCDVQLVDFQCLRVPQSLVVTENCCVMEGMCL